MKAAIHSAGFTIIPYGLMDSQPDYKVWAVYACLYRHGWNSADGCFASVATISRETGICEKVVQRSLSTLVTEGWIGIETRPGRTTVYRMKLENLEQKGPGSKMPRVKNAPGTSGKNAPPTRSKNAPLTRSPEQEPSKQENSLLLSGSSYELPTSAAANEFCSVVEASFQLEPPSSQNDQKRKPRAKGDDDFEKFWRTYLANPHRTVSQSKPKALAQWQKTIRTQLPAILLEALETEIAHQQAAATAGTFVANLPDCFRWLRDERYATVHDRPVNPDMINHDTYVF